jgi:hypothetical protein
MYVIQGNACDMPNSETPMSAERIAAQDRFVDSVGRHFTQGNAAMAQLIARLTPPAPVGTCADFTSSRSMSNITPFPFPLPRGVVGGSPVGVTGGGASGDGTVPAFGVPPDAGPTTPISGGWQWTNPGGGATYPWGGVQLEASRLIPPWACPGQTAPGLADGDLSTALSWGKWLAIALGVGLLASAARRASR